MATAYVIKRQAPGARSDLHLHEMLYIELQPQHKMVRLNALALGARNLRARSVPVQLRPRQFSVSAAKPKENQSFKSQLYESTQQRLKRERAEQEKFAQLQTQSPGGRSAALVFGT